MEERHCGNETLYSRLDDAINRGELTDEEAREIYDEQKEYGGYED